MRSRVCKIGVFTLALVFALAIGAAPAFAKTKTSTVSAAEVTAAKELTFKDSPFSKGFIDGRYSSYNFGPFQNFCITPDKKRIFATNIGKKKGSYNTGLICYKINGETADFEDGTVLDYYGHSDVLAVTQPNKAVESYHVWLAKSTVAYPKNKDETYGRIIERLTFSFANGSHTAQISEKIDLNDFVKTRVVKKKGKRVAKKFPYGAPVRVSAATNQDDNCIAFRLRFKKGQGCNYVMYDLNKLNAALDAALAGGSTTYDMKLAKDFQISNLKCNLTPLDGYQSFDVDKKYVYICGHTSKNVKYKAGIYKIAYKKTIAEVDKRKKKHIVQNIKMEIKTEVEGIKVMKSGKKVMYYFNTIPYKGGQLRWGQLVYKVIR